MKWSLFISLILTVSSVAFAKGEASSSINRGFFSVGLFYGASNPRLLNVDGTFSSYSGTEYGADLDISLLQNDSSELRLFLIGNQDSSSGGSAEGSLSGSLVAGGLKAYPSPNLFVGIGAGRQNVSITESGTSRSLSSQVTMLGAGVEFGLFGDFYGGIQAWYRSGALRSSENSSLSGNSFGDSVDAFLILIWSPPISIMNIYHSK